MAQRAAGLSAALAQRPVETSPEQSCEGESKLACWKLEAGSAGQHQHQTSTSVDQLQSSSARRSGHSADQQQTQTLGGLWVTAIRFSVRAPALQLPQPVTLAKTGCPLSAEVISLAWTRGMDK